MSQRLKESCQNILAGTGVVIDGPNPWDPQIVDKRFYQRVLAEGSLGLGESYMDGWWTCEKLDEFFARIMLIDVRTRLKTNLGLILDGALARFTNRQSKRRAFEVGEVHYDTGNDLYERMLDKTMTYTCGYWEGIDRIKEKNAEDGDTTLDFAEKAKLDLVCRKIGLKKGDRILDIGCGWGSMLIYAAKHYGVEGVGVTISKEQAALARTRAKGLPIEIRLQDYRDINESFNHVISLGMAEHVGHKNFRTYMEVAHRNLKPGGLFLLHTIGGLKSTRTTDAWIEKYIFPNSMLPSATQLSQAAEGLFVMEDWHNFGLDYDKTLMEWYKNAENAWGDLDASHYNERFKRMWRYYLLSCAGTFRARKNQLWQIVYSKGGVSEGYKTVR